MDIGSLRNQFSLVSITSTGLSRSHLISCGVHPAAQNALLGYYPAIVFVPHPIHDRTDAETRALVDTPSRTDPGCHLRNTALTRPPRRADYPCRAWTYAPGKRLTGLNDSELNGCCADMNEVMLSYRRDDSADITGRIYDRLVHSFGKDAIFKDVDSIPLGVNFKQHLDIVVSQCHALVVVIGRNWLVAADAAGSRRLDDPHDVVRLEIEAALQRRIPVMPLLVHGAAMPDETSLPLTLRELALCNGTTIGHDPQFQSDVNRLIQNLETIVSASPLRRPFTERTRPADIRKEAGETVKSRKGPLAAIVVGAGVSVGASYFFYLTLGEALTAREMFLTLVVSSLVVFVGQRLPYKKLTKVDGER